MTPSHRSNQIQEYFFSKKLKEIRTLKSEGKDIINLGIGSPDLMPHQSVLTSFSQSISEEDAFKYQSYTGLPDLHEAISAWYLNTYSINLDHDMKCLPTMGSKEALHFLCLAYLNHGDEALIPNPGYPAYSSAIKLSGGIPVPYDLTEKNSWHPDLDQLESLINSNTKVIFINYPHMPTGQNADKDQITTLIRIANKHGILVCNDNPYSTILCNEPFSIFQIESASENCLELNSLSKSSSMAGARMGLILGLDNLLKPIFKIQSSFSSGMFKPIQRAAVSALQNSEIYASSINSIYRERRTQVFELLNGLSCQYSKECSGLFVWAKIPERFRSSLELSDWLLHHGHVFITPGIIFGTQGERYIRVSLCQPSSLILKSIERINKIQINN